MQKKTISKRIKNKVEQWLETLPKDLSDLVRPCVVVSGGSIASMFLREEVNDYDVYLTDQTVLYRLCLYYGNKVGIGVLNGRDKDKLLMAEFNWIEGQTLPEWNGEDDYQSVRFVRLRSLSADQVKMDISGGKRFDVANDDSGEPEPFCVKFVSPNAISLSDDLQIVCRFSGSVEQIHSTYDFIHATNYWTFADGVVTNLAAMESLITKQLKYQGSLYPLTSIIRSKKFVKRGWNIGAGEYLKIMFQISELDLHDPVVLEDQLIGVDVAYFGMLIDILRNKHDKHPEFRMSSGWLNELIDRVFGEDLEEGSEE